MRNDLTLLHVQDYNSGPIMGLDNQYHTMGAHDFHVAMTDMLLAGFPIAGDPDNVFPALRQDQVAIGLPAAPFAGNGFTTVSEVQKAFDCLAKGTNCGSLPAPGRLPEPARPDDLVDQLGQVQRLRILPQPPGLPRRPGLKAPRRRERRTPGGEVPRGR